MTALETAQKTAADLVKLLDAAQADADRQQRAAIGFRTERDAHGTRIAEMERQAAASAKQIAELKEGLAAAAAEEDRLNLLLSPPAPVPVKEKPEPKHMTAAESRAEDRAEQKAEDARDDRAAVRASLQPSRHK